MSGDAQKPARVAPLKTVAPSAQHLAFRRALEECSRKEALEMQADEILAVLSHMVGQVVALQDQRRYTPDSLMNLVRSNIERGNVEAIDGLLNETWGTA